MINRHALATILWLFCFGGQSTGRTLKAPPIGFIVTENPPATAHSARHGDLLTGSTLDFFRFKNHHLYPNDLENLFDLGEQREESNYPGLEKVPSSFKRVSYGKAANEGQFPYAARLEIEKGDFTTLCGATLIAPSVLVTAAHCLYDLQGLPQASTVKAFIGNIGLKSEAETMYTGVDYVSSPQYNPTKRQDYFGDIALIKLDRNCTETPIPLSEGSSLQNGIELTVAGWGYNQNAKLPPGLHWTTVPYISRSKFNAWMKGYTKEYGWLEAFVLEKDHITAGLDKNGADTCAGDSGGPLVRLDHGMGSLIGVTSYGLTRECGSKNNVGMYTDIEFWADWIQTELEKLVK